MKICSTNVSSLASQAQEKEEDWLTRLECVSFNYGSSTVAWLVCKGTDYCVLTAAVIDGWIAAMLQLIACCDSHTRSHSGTPQLVRTSQCSASLVLLISSLVTEYCNVIGPHSTVWRKKLIYSKSPKSEQLRQWKTTYSKILTLLLHHSKLVISV